MPFSNSIKTTNVVVTERTPLNANTNDVLEGKNFIGVDSSEVKTGTIPVLSAKSDTMIVAGESIVIPIGYNPMSYKITAKSLEEETQATATASDILNEKTAWVDGKKIVGTMPNFGFIRTKLDAGETYGIAAGYYQNGIIETKSLEEQTPSEVESEQILQGYDAWSNGKHVFGTMEKIDSFVNFIKAGEVFNIPAGYHTGNGNVIAIDLDKQTEGDATSSDILSDKVAWVNGKKVVGSIPVVSNDIKYLNINEEFDLPAGYYKDGYKVTCKIPVKEGTTIYPSNEEKVIPLAGSYLASDIVVAGVHGLKYNRSLGFVKDEYDEPIIDKGFIGPEAIIAIKLDDWHNKNTTNIYHLKFSNLISNGISVNAELDIIFDNYVLNTVSTLDNITIETKLSETGYQLIIIKNVRCGSVTISEKLATKEM